MSGKNSEQEYFSDGISEDIITDLSKLSEVHVIARNSSFTYKGKSVDVKQVGRDLGVRYVLEGSVRKAGNRVTGNRPTHRHRQWHTHLGRPLRSRPRRHLRRAG